jgi:hypothetical protein
MSCALLSVVSLDLAPDLLEQSEGSHVLPLLALDRHHGPQLIQQPKYLRFLGLAQLPGDEPYFPWRT